MIQSLCQINSGLQSHTDEHTSLSLRIKPERTKLKQMGPYENGLFLMNDE